MVSTAVSDGADIIASPTMASQFLKYKRLMQSIFQYNLGRTDILGYFQADVILAVEFPGKSPRFAYIYCFPLEVWLLIAISIVVLALVTYYSGTNEKTSVGKIVFYFSIVLLSKSIEKAVLLAIPKAVLSIWFLMALILTNEFIAYFMDFMITALPMVRIDTFEDLVGRKDMKIFVREDVFRFICQTKRHSTQKDPQHYATDS